MLGHQLFGWCPFRFSATVLTMDEKTLNTQYPEPSFQEKLLETAKVVGPILIIAIVFFAASEVFLLIFAGLLLAVFLTSLAQFISKKTKLSYAWSVGLLSLLILLALGLGGLWAAPSVAAQFDELTKKIPESIEELKSQIQHYSWAQPMLNQAQPEQVIGDGKKALSRATGALSGIMGAITSFVIVLFIGIYGTVEPGIYKRGLLRLIPLRRRSRIQEVLEETTETLRWWLIGKFISMGIIGVLTTVGLWFLEIPLALVLGIIAALLTFIPNIGPLLSAIPAVLLGLMDGPEQALWIALLYLGIQTVESYLITPVIQRKTIDMPPGLTLATQVLLGVIFSGLGVALATPLTAVALVMTKRLYVEDTLGDQLPDGK